MVQDVSWKDDVRGYIQKFPDWVDNEINNNYNKHSLRSNTKCYGDKTHQTNSQNSDTTAPSCRELYHLQLLLQAASPETFEYTLVYALPPPPHLIIVVANRVRDVSAYSAISLFVLRGSDRRSRCRKGRGCFCGCDVFDHQAVVSRDILRHFGQGTNNELDFTYYKNLL